jgi:hypothetical protein
MSGNQAREVNATHAALAHDRALGNGAQRPGDLLQPIARITLLSAVKQKAFALS